RRWTRAWPCRRAASGWCSSRGSSCSSPTRPPSRWPPSLRTCSCTWRSVCSGMCCPLLCCVLCCLLALAEAPLCCGVVVLRVRIYFVYYVGMKLIAQGETVFSHVYVYAAVAIVSVCIGLSGFLANVTKKEWPLHWSHTLNRPCWVVIFGSHDIWHFASA